MPRIRVSRTTARVLLAAALAMCALQGPASAAAAPHELLPDLRMELPTNLTLERASGHYWLRFSAMIANLGDGPLEVRSTRRCPDCTHMRVSQAILQSDGTFKVRATRTRQRYDDSDGHHHWHVMGMERYELFPMDAPFARRSVDRPQARLLLLRRVRAEPDPAQLPAVPEVLVLRLRHAEQPVAAGRPVRRLGRPLSVRLRRAVRGPGRCCARRLPGLPDRRPEQLVPRDPQRQQRGMGKDPHSGGHGPPGQPPHADHGHRAEPAQLQEPAAVRAADCEGSRRAHGASRDAIRKCPPWRHVTCGARDRFGRKRGLGSRAGRAGVGGLLTERRRCASIAPSEATRRAPAEPRSSIAGV